MNTTLPTADAIARFAAVRGTRFVSATVRSPIKLRKGAPAAFRIMRIVFMAGADYHPAEDTTATPDAEKWFENLAPGLIRHRKTGALYLSARTTSVKTIGYKPAEPLPKHKLAPRKPSGGDWRMIRIDDLIELKGLPDAVAA